MGVCREQDEEKKMLQINTIDKQEQIRERSNGNEPSLQPLSAYSYQETYFSRRGTVNCGSKHGWTICTTHYFSARYITELCS
jgi:hypothetical protein